jgi:large subunit ribosomal protein L6
MSNLIRKKIFLPRLVVCEISIFDNGFIYWFSGPSYTFKYLFISNLIFRIQHKNLIYIPTGLNLAFNFFKIQRYVTLKKENKKLSLLHTKLKNLLVGASVGFKNFLRIRGVGYKFNISPLQLTIHAGYSHLLQIKIPSLQSLVINKKNTLICGRSVYLVKLNTFFAATRSLRTPDIYKGKGIRYRKDFIFRKEGKKKKTV